MNLPLHRAKYGKKYLDNYDEIRWKDNSGERSLSGTKHVYQCKACGTPVHKLQEFCCDQCEVSYDREETP